MLTGAERRIVAGSAKGSLGHEKERKVKRGLWQAVLADPHPMWLDAVGDLLRDGDIGVAAKTSPGPDALAALEEIRPDVLVTELVSRGGELDAPAYIRDALARSPETKIVVLAAAADRATVHEVLLAGAGAYVVKTARQEDLLAAVRQTFDGSVFMAPAAFLASRATRAVEPVDEAAEPVDEAKLDRLTPREQEILRLTADGLTNVQLARLLWVSEQTIKFHLSNIYRKLGVTNRTEASRWAQVHGLLAA